MDYMADVDDVNVNGAYNLCVFCISVTQINTVNLWIDIHRI